MKRWLVCGSSLMFFVALNINSQAPPSPPLYSAGPVTDYQAALPNTSDVLQFRRGERYNVLNSDLSELGEDSETLWDLPVTHFKKNPMPFDESDTVVVGTVTGGQAHFSNDKRDIYSEFKMSLRESIKNPVAPYLQAGNSIDIQRKGGSIKLPSGKLLIRAPLAESMPRVGARYLLFLKYDQNTEDYAVINGYELDDSEVYRLDDLSFKESNHPQVYHLLTGEGVSESVFLSRVKSALFAHQQKAAN